MNMHDQRGTYYYPNPAQKTTRMYVKEHDGVIHFRLYSSDDPQIWERHGWLTLEVIKQAAALYSGDNDPTRLYDEAIAREVLRQIQDHSQQQ